MNVPQRILALSYEIVLLAFAGAVQPAELKAFEVEPLRHAHAHNDYWHKRPLVDALEQGLTSVEADVYLVDGTLLVGHDRKELHADRNLESLYLAPLAERVRRYQGRVMPGCDQFILLIDFKSESQLSCEALSALLERYREMLAVVEHDRVIDGPVHVIVTGNRPAVDADKQERTYFGLDGRIGDLDARVSAARMPMISDNWQNHFAWRGDGAMPAAERQKLKGLADKAHAAGRVLRFWATPEKETVWAELRGAGVDLVGSDDLQRLAKFFREKDPSAAEAENNRK